MLQMQMESGLQQEAELVFQELGVSSDTIVKRLFDFVRTEHRLPTELRIPNAETRAVFESTDAGEDLIEFSSTEELFTSLGI